MQLLATVLFLAVSAAQSSQVAPLQPSVVPAAAPSPDVVRIDWSHVPDRDADLAAVRGEYVAAVNAHDASVVSSMYTSDALASFGDGDLVRGRTAVIERLQGGLGGSPASLTLMPTRLSAAQEVGWETGTFTIRPGDGGTASEGIYVAIYSRGVDHRWRIAMEVRTTGRSLPAVVW